MTQRPLGPIIPDWQPATDPFGVALKGDYAELSPLDVARDAAGLWAQMQDAPWLWDYLYEPAPTCFEAFKETLQPLEKSVKSPCLVIRAKGQAAPLGYACFWTNAIATGSTEIGNVNLSPALQHTPTATETFFLMTDWAFGHGYRRMEWKCNALNAPSRRAAQRLGFAFEGIFRNHLVVKGRNRDTAWFAITDTDWAKLAPAYRTWLNPQNFDANGQQHTSLSSLTAPHLFARDPSL